MNQPLIQRIRSPGAHRLGWPSAGGDASSRFIVPNQLSATLFPTHPGRAHRLHDTMHVAQLTERLGRVDRPAGRDAGNVAAPRGDGPERDPVSWTPDYAGDRVGRRPRWAVRRSIPGPVPQGRTGARGVVGQRAQNDHLRPHRMSASAVRTAPRTGREPLSAALARWGGRRRRLLWSAIPMLTSASMCSVSSSRFLSGGVMVDRYTEWADWTGWADE